MRYKFTETMHKLYNNKNMTNGNSAEIQRVLWMGLSLTTLT